MIAITDPVLRQQLTEARNKKDASKENAQKVEEKKYNQPVSSVVVVTGADGKPQLNDKGQPVIQVTLADGTTVEMPVTENIRVVGSDGKEVSISKDGTITPKDGKPITPPAAIAMTDPTKLGDGSIVIKFSAADGQKFGFDGITGGEGIWGRDNFKLGGTTYYVPIKSIQPGVEDYVIFEQQGSGTTKFSLEMNGKATPITPNGSRISLNIPFVGNASLFALDYKNQVVGKLTILSYPMVTKKVVLVSLNKNGTPGASNLENQLNEIFKSSVATVKVEEIEFTSTTYKGIMNADRDHYKYSNDMRSIVNEFKKKYTQYTSDQNTVYLFFGKSDQANLGGVMNRGYQFGFIFENDPKVIAHELGHGIFRLQHTSDDNSNGKAEVNLMDYSPGGINLYKYQWAQMQNPPSVWPIMESPDDADYETDGHYSTVVLVALQLGMDRQKAMNLGKAAEDPDTDIERDGTYNMDQTWSYFGDQQNIHSLTGGFHGIEEMMTALKFLYTQSDDLKEMGKLLHRYGDTYAHTNLKNILPLSVRDMHLANASQQTLETVIYSWKGMSGVQIKDRVEPWIEFINYYVRKYGNEFFTNTSIQKNSLGGRTLGEYLGYIYNQPSDKFEMYGNGFYTIDHGNSDGFLPDQIYIRPDWYLSYVKNLAVLLSIKFRLNFDRFDIDTFTKMVEFVKKEQCSMKGIIDYEIKRKVNDPVMKIPIFQRPIFRIGVYLDNNKYDEVAESASVKAQKYAFEVYNKISTRTTRTRNSILITID